MERRGSTEYPGSWAVETDNFLNSEGRSSSSVTPWKEQDSSPALDSRDLRHRVRRGRHRDDLENSHQPNYLRQTDGLSPLRSPLNADQKSSDSHRGDYKRRGSGKNDSYKKESNPRQSLSPIKKNRISYTALSPPRSRPSFGRDSDDGTPVVSRSVYQDGITSRSRRRLNLPSDKDSDTTDDGPLNPQNEEDMKTLARREKQISYGKSTESYKQYIAAVPKNERCVDRKKHPRTPIKWRKCSRRNWDAQIKAWKRYLHLWAKDDSDVLNLSSPLRLALPESKETDSECGTSTTDEAAAGVEEEIHDEDILNLNDDSDDSFLEGFELECT